MSGSEYRARRATVDDLPGLHALWKTMHFPDVELERRLTEFQVVATPEGTVEGAVGLEMAGRQGIIHSEAFGDFSKADTLRPLLWERIHKLINNHGLARMWTKETAPFWRQTGFQPAESSLISKLPAAWAAEADGWLTLQIRDEELLEKTLAVEFARIRQEEKRNLERVLRPMKLLKIAATVLAVILSLVVLYLCVQMLLNQTGRLPR